MIKKRRNRLLKVYKQSQALSNWLWMGIVLDDTDVVRQDIEWATKISQQITNGLAAVSGPENGQTAKAPLPNGAKPRAAEDKDGHLARLRSKPVVAENIATGETLEFSSGKAAAAALGVYRSAISRVISGKAKSTKGYRFRFAK